MKYICLIAIFGLIIGCRGSNESASKSKKQSAEVVYPEKVIDLLALIKSLKPKTIEQDWIKLVDQKIGLPDEDIILDGGGGLGEMWMTIGIGAGDEWALSIQSYQGSGYIWEAKVIKTSIPKFLANEPCDVDTIYPYYYQGHIVFSEDEKQKILNQQGEQDGTGQPATHPESKSEGSDKPQPEAEGRSR